MQPKLEHRNTTENGFNHLKLTILSQKYSNELLAYFLETKQLPKAQHLVKDVFNTVINEIDRCTQSINVDAMIYQVARQLVN